MSGIKQLSNISKKNSDFVEWEPVSINGGKKVYRLITFKARNQFLDSLANK